MLVKSAVLGHDLDDWLRLQLEDLNAVERRRSFTGAGYAAVFIGRLQYGSPGSVAEQNAGVSIFVICKSGKLVRTDNQRSLVVSGRNQTIGYGQAVNKTGAG